tara:strand:+ start:834 stop:1643 length:810 start_codon:yes stop_codon:yes gene_type:complete
MSSIYKKGRDGYYYYQTYVYNPESKKKDKRIFHALRTKDLIEAKTKQRELDLQHEKQSYEDSSLSKLYNYFKNKPAVAILVGILAAIIFFIDLFRVDNLESISTKSIGTEKVINTDERIYATVGINDSIKSNFIELIDSKADNSLEKIKADPETKNVETKIIIPKYSVERIDRLSGAFEQGKIYVTIDKNSSNESQKLLCENIMKQYSEFSNIVICLYSNDRAGQSLANGNNQSVSVEEQKQSWLAMYTYNSVEGEYFDDNPSGYLGIY